MYAVFASGGKQHRVEVGTLIDIEKLDASVGETVNFSDVLAVSDSNGDIQVGSPYLENVTITSEVVQQTKGKKILVFKSKRRKGYSRRRGHRQNLTRIRITGIEN
ncbi:TPA: 50S ribosomal protein L21 [Candidatus Poribacteria bacterium]|jgi:large subunit ribosomal protein L21|nr:50S ribosomal protein L21 [Candidatus Poribacteria bacterium]HIA66461.1 50S ribosomal protein L21 [Candidatus Poribacteria bacterium]HIB90019.1 50S ribosomal protein L21 [Candidatus Poribacteria bacterium]HIC03022.1 50S ribosomal protein L21 [Candidatus Poribacteria bacterium]HIM10617.1 50S ribosomal protein L21 [Candidatus Poribacteria bacterium]